ncbi:MAG TPA: 3-deoxy-7-phosphoheptulonate synthase [Sphingomicrobium sp.]|nr:3-deoxy-7-phosphoheptulonate synthase [Sphingomicrobium sp.]
MSVAVQDWKPSDWRARPALQQPDFADPAAAQRILADIAQRGPLVTAEECAELRLACAAAARGESFILQAGDCAESLDADPAQAADAMAALIRRLAGRVPQTVVPIGRIGGQFAKPRSASEEVREGRSLPVYRGDSINRLAFEESARAHDPSLLGAAHRHSSATIRHLRESRSGLFASHEALVLAYEEALCFPDPDRRWWAGSGHMLWIGERTRQVDGAHVAFAAGIANAVGVKCGPSLGSEELLRLADRLDPGREPGRLLLIARFGADSVERGLAPLIRAARSEGLAAAWMLDPMHGNTRRIGGRKQRRVADMLAETKAFFALCRSEGVVPAGLHLEVTTGEAAECVGADGIDPMADFPCDPRLTAAQAELVIDTAMRC